MRFIHHNQIQEINEAEIKLGDAQCHKSINFGLFKKNSQFGLNLLVWIVFVNGKNHLGKQQEKTIMEVREEN